MRIISIYPLKLANSSNIEFQSSHPRYQTYLQKHFIKPESQAKVKLLRPLFHKDGFDNIISADDLGTMKGHNNIAIILLAQFMP